MMSSDTHILKATTVTCVENSRERLSVSYIRFRTISFPYFHPYSLIQFYTKQNKLRGFSPQTYYTDRATAAGRRS
jgi:hypothetical protein